MQGSVRSAQMQIVGSDGPRTADGDPDGGDDDSRSAVDASASVRLDIVFSASAHTGVDDSSPWLPCEEDATTSTMFDFEAELRRLESAF